MKTTIEIDDELFRRAKVRAAEQGSSLRSVVEDALRRALDEHRTGSTGFVLRDARVGGSGLRSEFTPWHWDKVADLVYGDRDE
ncbi:MAG: type II toxin-antitoxin system VapB family antitoxin [Pseudonocardiaceae bacterium]